MFHRLLTDFLVVRRFSAGDDVFGEGTLGEPEVLPCAFSDRQQLFRDLEGEERNSTATVMLAEPLSTRDLVWLPFVPGEIPDPTTAEGLHPAGFARDRSRVSGVALYQVFF